MWALVPRLLSSRIGMAAVLCAALLALGGYLNLSGYNAGYRAAARAQQAELRAVQARLFRAGEALSRKASALARMQQERAANVQILEEAARAGSGSERPGIGPDGVRRLERRWPAR